MIEGIIQKTMLALALTAGCQNREEQERQPVQEIVKTTHKQGIPAEVVSYERPDEFILQVWEGLKTLNNGRPYEINVKDGYNQFYLCFDGQGFMYHIYMESYEEEREKVSLINQSGGLYGNPYKSEGAVLAESLKDTAVRRTLFTAYEHRIEMAPGACIL